MNKANVRVDTLSAAKEAYLNAFSGHYPAKKVELKPAGRARGGPPSFYIVIDGDKGNLSFTENDLREATEAFLR